MDLTLVLWIVSVVGAAGIGWLLCSLVTFGKIEELEELAEGRRIKWLEALRELEESRC